MNDNPAKKPNVIVFFTDQQRWDTVGAHGNPLDLTPNFDRMAREGMFIRNSFTCQPVCGPARSVMQTGKYATETGCYRNDIPLPQEEKTLAGYFKDGGYQTAYIGKWHLASQDPVPKNERGGYDYWLASNILEFTSWPYETTVYDENCEPVKLPGYRVDALTDAAIRYIDTAQNEDDPFFLFLSFLEPHHQNQTDDYPAPVGYEERIRAKMKLPEDLEKLGGSSAEHYAGYMGMVARIDEAFGRMIDALISLGELDNTIILFTSDHGNHFKTRNDEYKRSCHEASIRVPTLLHGPRFNGRGDYPGFFSIIDIAPTLLEAAGLRVPDRMQGHALLKIADSADAVPQEAFIQVSEDHVGRALRTPRWKYEIVAKDKDGWNDMNSNHYAEAFLYDLETDPHEQNNLVNSAEHEAIRASLRVRLSERMQLAGEQKPAINAVP